MRYLVFEDELSQETIEDLLVELGGMNPCRRVYVNSPGGEFEFFSLLGPAIERKALTTIAGDVRSAAIVLFLLGHRRQALADATFCFHEVRALVTPQQAITITELEQVEEYAQEMSEKRREVYQEWLRQMKSAQSWFLYFLREKTGLPASTFLNLMHSEASLSAPEAVRYGIVHQVVPADFLERD